MFHQVFTTELRICIYIRVEVLQQAFAAQAIGRQQTDIEDIRDIARNDLCLQTGDARIPVLFILAAVVIVLGVIRHLDAVVRVAAVEPTDHLAREGIKIHNCKP